MVLVSMRFTTRATSRPIKSSREKNLRSPWDTLHAGRAWAHSDPNLKDARTEGQIVQDIADHFLKLPPLTSVDAVINQFLEDMRAAF
jgi:hypothetical protein